LFVPSLRLLLFPTLSAGRELFGVGVRVLGASGERFAVTTCC
jgi:hypothetical protein